MLYYYIMDILTTFDSVTIITLATIFFGFMGVVVRTCFLSKCQKCNICFGIVDIERNTHDENEEMKIGIDQRTLANEEKSIV